jgi:hypothetical protein
MLGLRPRRVGAAVLCILLFAGRPCQPLQGGFCDGVHGAAGPIGRVAGRFSGAAGVFLRA